MDQATNARATIVKSTMLLIVLYLIKDLIRHLLNAAKLAQGRRKPI